MFNNPWLADGKQSDFFTMSGATAGLGVAAWVGETIFDFESVLARSADARSNARQATRLFKVGIGPALGIAGIAISGIESYFDSDGFTKGDGAKGLLGVALVGAAFVPGLNLVAAAYAIADIAVGGMTGFSLTDRLGTAVDYSMK